MTPHIPKKKDLEKETEDEIVIDLFRSFFFSPISDGSRRIHLGADLIYYVGHWNNMGGSGNLLLYPFQLVVFVHKI